MSGPAHGSGVRPADWYAHDQRVVAQSGARRDEPRRLEALLAVRIAGREHALRAGCAR